MCWNQYTPQKIVPLANRLHHRVRKTNSGGPIEGISKQIIGSGDIAVARFWPKSGQKGPTPQLAGRPLL
jgi:hypothetical protein